MMRRGQKTFHEHNHLASERTNKRHGNAPRSNENEQDRTERTKRREAHTKCEEVMWHLTTVET